MRTPRPTRHLIGPLAMLLAGAGLPAWAQSLQELYEAARNYDAAFLSARAQAQSAEHRAAQADALLRPSASLSSNASLTQVDAPRVGSGDSNSLGATLSGKYPLFNKSTAPTIEQSRKAVQLAQADLEAVEQDLIVRLSQAYFDVLAAQDALATTPARPPSPSSSPRPSATSRSAPPPSRTRARPRPGSTSPRRRRSPRRMTCAPSASLWTSWWAAAASPPRAC